MDRHKGIPCNPTCPVSEPVNLPLKLTFPFKKSPSLLANVSFIIIDLFHIIIDLSLPRDGAPLSINLTTGATAASENGDFIVQCWTQDAGKHSGEKYDWRCVVSIPGGGAVTNNDEFAFKAPRDGYAPSLEITMRADNPAWQDTVELKFYYHLANGLYGRMVFTMVAFNQHFCMIESALNPSGSQNLEPSQ
jgi:hypothetical protein